jgi:hypothetical protein
VILQKALEKLDAKIQKWQVSIPPKCT